MSIVGKFARRTLAGFVREHGAGFVFGVICGGLLYKLLSAVINN